MTYSILLVVGLSAVFAASAVAPPLSDEGVAERKSWFRIVPEGPGMMPRIGRLTQEQGHYWAMFHLNGVIDLAVLAEIERELEAGAVGTPAGYTLNPYARFEFYPDRVEACESIDFDSDGRDWPTVCHPLPVEDFREALAAYRAAMTEWQWEHRDLIEAQRRINHPDDTK